MPLFTPPFPQKPETATQVERVVPFRPDQLFALVARVEDYPQFVPYWHRVRVRERRENAYRTDQVVRLGPVRHAFSTITRLEPESRIIVESADPPFRHLHLEWVFTPVGEGQCHISLTAAFDLRFPGLNVVGTLLSRESIQRMISAFEQRAQAIYGIGDANAPQINP